MSEDKLDFVGEVAPIVQALFLFPFADVEESESHAPVEDTSSVFTRLEATRAELESQFGFNRFLEIYTQIQVLYTTNAATLTVAMKYCNSSTVSWH